MKSIPTAFATSLSSSCAIVFKFIPFSGNNTLFKNALCPKIQLSFEWIFSLKISKFALLWKGIFAHHHPRVYIYTYIRTYKYRNFLLCSFAVYAWGVCDTLYFADLFVEGLLALFYVNLRLSTKMYGVYKCVNELNKETC